MTQLASEYKRYQESSVMKELAAFAHGQNYIGQTSSATFSEIVEKLEKMTLSENCHVLDAGCGNGAFSIELARHFPYLIEGVDISESLIEIANDTAQKNHLSNRCQFFKDDFTSLTRYSKAKFDLILCVGSLYWGQDLMKILHEWRRITQLGGKCLIFLNCAYDTLNQEEQLAIGNTQFIPIQALQESLSKTNWGITYWNDSTDQYLLWLNRWCQAMQNNRDDIEAEMGREASSQLYRRFSTYLSLAESKKVRRTIFMVEHV